MYLFGKVGGSDGKEVYNPHKHLHCRPHTHNPSSNFGTELMEGLIFAIGGLTPPSPHKVDCSMETDEWQEADDISCSGLSCCLVTVYPESNFPPIRPIFLFLSYHVLISLFCCWKLVLHYLANFSYHNITLRGRHINEIELKWIILLTFLK